MLYIIYPGMTEVWCNLDINNVEPIYEISTSGRIRNKITNKFLKGSLDRKGYRQVMLKTNIFGKRIKKFRVHRLVAITFLKHKRTTKKNTVNHKNCNKDDNSAYNLEWTTVQENNLHALQNNIIHKCDECHNSIFTNNQIHNICMLLEQSVEYPNIIDVLNLENSINVRVAISRIKRRLTYINISKEYKWELSKNLNTKMGEIKELISEGYNFVEICNRLKLKPNTVNKDIYRNIINYGIE